ncbi:MAG: hypothetical protein QNL54_09130 [Rhodobacterales bacterium]|jgi:hypothetical protein
MAQLGHNNGPTMEPGHGWRTHCWTVARKNLLGHMPIEIIRAQVKRAAEIGLDYKTYATVTGTSGQDIYAFLFSSNSLRLHLSARDLPQDRAEKLRAIVRCDKIVISHRPIDPARLPADFEALHRVVLRDAQPAPKFSDSWSQLRNGMRNLLGAHKLSPGTVVLIGDTGFERDWTAAGKFAAYLPAERFFPEGSPT